MPIIKNKLRSPICLEIKPVALYLAPGKTAQITNEQKDDPAVISALGKNIITIEKSEVKTEDIISNKKKTAQSNSKRKTKKNSKA